MLEFLAQLAFYCNQSRLSDIDARKCVFMRRIAEKLRSAVADATGSVKAVNRKPSGSADITRCLFVGRRTTGWKHDHLFMRKINCSDCRNFSTSFEHLPRFLQTIRLTDVVNIYAYSLAVWCSGNALVSINAVALHRARLVLGWVTAFGQVNCLIT